MIAIIIYLILINGAAFSLMRGDKTSAKRGKRRVPEKKLLGVAAAGGSFGALAAMRTYRHKTKHASFAFGLPIMAIVHLCLLGGLFRWLLNG